MIASVAFNVLGDGLRSYLNVRTEIGMSRAQHATMASTGDEGTDVEHPVQSGTALRVVDLSTSFRTNSGNVVDAVRSVSFELEAGETLVLLGESGSGKSVTARSIMRLHGRRAQVRGEVTLAGVSVFDLSENEMRALRGSKVALVPQDPSAALDPLRRVGKQISEVLLLHKMCDSRAAAKERAIELLRQVGIPNPQRAYRSYPHELSGGMRQRVVIAIGDQLRSGGHHRRRADHRPGRDRAGPDPGAVRRTAAPTVDRPAHGHP